MSCGSESARVLSSYQPSWYAHSSAPQEDKGALIFCSIARVLMKIGKIHMVRTKPTAYTLMILSTRNTLLFYFPHTYTQGVSVHILINTKILYTLFWVSLFFNFIIHLGNISISAYID